MGSRCRRLVLGPGNYNSTSKTRNPAADRPDGRPGSLHFTTGEVLFLACLMSVPLTNINLRSASSADSAGPAVAGHEAEQAGDLVERGQAEPFDDRGRRGVAVIDLGQNLGQAERAERVLDHRARRLGRVALAPHVGCQAVDDLR